MTFTLQRHRAVGPVSTLAAAALLLTVTACQSDGDDSADPCTGLSHALLNYFMGGQDFTATESGNFPHRGYPTEEVWSCVIEVDNEEAFRFIGSTRDDTTMPSPTYSSEYFTYRGGVGFNETYESAQETGCRMEPEEQQ